MTQLTSFRDHCRRMATAEHKPECPSVTAREPFWPTWTLADDASHLTWRGPKPKWTPPVCDGCLTDADRAMFARLAGEVQEYLDREEDEPMVPTSHSVADVPLFGGML